MAYWGLARASRVGGLGGENRPAEMIREAVKRKAHVSEREQLYIDAWPPACSPIRYTRSEPGRRSPRGVEPRHEDP